MLISYVTLFQVTLYECLTEGKIKLLQAYADPSVSFLSYDIDKIIMLSIFKEDMLTESVYAKVKVPILLHYIFDFEGCLIFVRPSSCNG